MPLIGTLDPLTPSLARQITCRGVCVGDLARRVCQVSPCSGMAWAGIAAEVLATLRASVAG